MGDDLSPPPRSPGKPVCPYRLPLRPICPADGYAVADADTHCHGHSHGATDIQPDNYINSHSDEHGYKAHLYRDTYFSAATANGTPTNLLPSTDEGAGRPQPCAGSNGHNRAGAYGHPCSPDGNAGRPAAYSDAALVRCQ